jgi:hypothetical protein
MLLALLAAPAHGFCGTFVGGAGTEIFNSASQVALVRQDGWTTLTMANDFEGAVGEFALVVPVPTVITEDQVHVLDPAVFTRLDAYSGPRLVEYTCDQLYPEKPDWSPSLGCRSYDLAMDGALDSGGMGGVDPVEVEERFIVGEYEIVVLSADDSLAMLQWLSDQGYAVSPAAADAIQEYLDQGSYFFAARVDPSLIPEGQDDLSPLQFSYESEAFGLPIRLGTVNAVDAQDLIVYAITPGDEGRVGISNYSEATMDSVCLWQDDDWDDDFASFYGAELDAALSNSNDAQWVAEYGWHVTPWGGKCDPCPPVPEDGMDPLPGSDVVALGFDAQQWDSGGNVSDFYFTRLHMRYTPQQATQDLVLYASGITENAQQRYVRHEGYLEWEFPLCDGGWVESDPGSCMDEGRGYKQRMKYWEDQGGSPAATARAGAVVGLLGLLGLLAARRRRR